MGLQARILLGMLTALLFGLALTEPDATSRAVRAEGKIETRLEAPIYPV